MAFLSYWIYRFLICFRSKKPTKDNLKMTIALAKGRKVFLWLFMLSHIYKELWESQERSEDYPFMIKEKKINIWSLVVS